MHTPIIQRLGIICVLFMTMACHGYRGYSVNQESPVKDTLVLSGCQEKISITVGSIVKIKLEAISGTGYQWLLNKPSLLLQQLGSDVMEYSMPGQNIPGQKGYQVLQFKAVKKGEEMIRLDYRRTFEKGIEKSCVIKIIVN
jgi:predicted secreted protein